MPELLDRIRTEMSARLAELRPLVDEHTRLSAALQALGDVDSRKAVRAPPAPAASRSRAPRATPRKHAPRGANRLAMLRAVEDRPGATSAELATASGVQANTVHALVARLVKSGNLRKETLPTGRTGYSLAHAQPEASAGSAPDAPDAAQIADDGVELAARRASSPGGKLELADAQVDRRLSRACLRGGRQLWIQTQGPCARMPPAPVGPLQE